MKIGLGQMDICWEDKETNQIKCLEMMKEAKGRNVDFLVFPEMTLTGFTMNTETMKEDFADSFSLSFFQRACREYSMAAAFGMILEDGLRAKNHCVIIDDSGRVLANYAKIHPFSGGGESECYTGGKNMCSCIVSGICVVPTICYDLRFPVLYQIASKDCDLILVIANWPKSRREHWEALLKARAIENQCYIAGVNRTGNDITLEYCGDSMVVDPLGNIITRNMYKKEGLAIADISHDQVLSAKTLFDVRKDRREELYAKWYLE